MSNFFIGNDPKIFYLWVDPENFNIFNNFSLVGTASVKCENENSHLLFIPNSDYKAVISPYQSNIAKKMRIEYNFEIARPKIYTSRLEALFLLESKEAAIAYKELHFKHVQNRILIQGTTVGTYNYSLHDSGWFDFFKLDASFDIDTINYCVNAYWHGAAIKDCQLTIYGHDWSQPPSMEVLFSGQLEISDESRAQIRERYISACKKEPTRFPKMYFNDDL